MNNLSEHSCEIELLSVSSVSSVARVHVPLGRGGELVEARFLARPNRFLVEAELDGAIVQAHLADRGRLKETLVPGVRLLLARHNGVGRKTQFQAVAAILGSRDWGLGAREWELGARENQTTSTPNTQHLAPSTYSTQPLVPNPYERLASLDTHLPNRLIEAALRARALPQFANYEHIRREVQVGASRFDFQLADSDRCTIEVKSAGYVENGVGLFPDAPTTRGRRHLEELASLEQAGERAAVVFVAQGAARSVAMNTAIDPEFAATLRHAAAQAVEVYAYACPLTREGITLGEQIPVEL